MRRRRAAVRQLVYASAVVIAQAGVPEGSAAASFQDSFASGDAQLDWASHPMFECGAVQGQAMKDAPDGDGGIGVLRHQGGSLGTVSYARTAKAEDSFEVSAWVYCPREAEGRDGTLTGLAFYLHAETDPEEGGFYRLVCDYRFGTGSFSLAYIGANIGRQPLELERWPLIEQTAPAADDGWQRLRIDVEAGLIELYLDDVKLNERPIPAERQITDIANIDAGYATSARPVRRKRVSTTLPTSSAKQRDCDRWEVDRTRHAHQLSSRLSFRSAGRAERSTRSRRSGISWLRRSSPSSRSASSSSASRFFGLGQTIGLDLLSSDKQDLA